MIYGKQGMLEKEINHYREALRINPRDVQTHNNLGTVFMRMGWIDEALRHYQVALSINPYLPVARRNLARAYQKKIGR